MKNAIKKDVTPPISFTVALARLHAAVSPVARTEHVPLHHAAGRVLADTVTAAVDVPPFDRALMDGFAVQARDTATASPATPARLTCRSVVYTGEAPQHAVDTGTCVGIATGAVLPAGADAVVQIEHTDHWTDTARGETPGASPREPHTASESHTGASASRRPPQDANNIAGADTSRRLPQDANRIAGVDTVCILHPVTPRQNVGRRGGDLATGDTVCEPGMLLTPARLGAIAACGVTAVEVYARPTVAIASTGNEVVAPGTALAPGQIHDINRYTLPPIVAANGGVAHLHDTIRDDVASLDAFFDQVADVDLVIVSGGSSVGDRDLLGRVVAARGEIVFHGIAVKPGKPTLLARVGRSLVLGLPGNPTSCLSNAYILLIPLLRAMARLPAWRPERRTLTLARNVANTSGRHVFFSVRVEGDQVLPAFKGSGEITSLSQADGYIEIPADVPQIAAGTAVSVTMF